MRIANTVIALPVGSDKWSKSRVIAYLTKKRREARMKRAREEARKTQLLHKQNEVK